jgi:hypothetical protein
MRRGKLGEENLGKLFHQKSDLVLKVAVCSSQGRMANPYALNEPQAQILSAIGNLPGKRKRVPAIEGLVASSYPAGRSHPRRIARHFATKPIARATAALRRPYWSIR